MGIFSTAANWSTGGAYGAYKSRKASSDADKAMGSWEDKQSGYMDSIMSSLKSGRASAEKSATEDRNRIYGAIDGDFKNSMDEQQKHLQDAKDLGLGAEQYAEVRAKYKPQEKRLRSSIAKSGIRGAASVAMREDIERARDRELAIMSKQVKDQSRDKLFNFMATKKMAADSDRSSKIAEEMSWKQLEISPYLAQMGQMPHSMQKPKQGFVSSLFGGIF